MSAGTAEILLCLEGASAGGRMQKLLSFKRDWEGLSRIWVVRGRMIPLKRRMDLGKVGKSLSCMVRLNCLPLCFAKYLTVP